MKTKSRSRGIVPVIDSREQRPYRFENSIVRTLPAGDYSIKGYETRVAVERKTRADAYGSLGRNRGRFERELRRLADYDYAAVVIESSLPAFLIPPDFSRMHPKSAVCSLLAWSVSLNLPIFFCGDRAHARATTWHLLEKFSRYATEGCIERE